MDTTLDNNSLDTQDTIDVYADVYGDTYTQAEALMRSNEDALLAQEHVGFDSFEECATWAKEHRLTVTQYSKSAQNYYYTSHVGQCLRDSAYKKAYGDILFVWHDDGKGRRTKMPWLPSGFATYNNARAPMEALDESRGPFESRPLYHRDYCTPKGNYDPVRGTFNRATPFPCFAANRKALCSSPVEQQKLDTSHIYRYIDAIAGENALYLLAWLRRKMCQPLQKTEVVPVFVSKKQGTGKSTFANVICKALFGSLNVVVTDAYDSSNRFNADVVDALVVCMEERDHTDSRVSTDALKSRSTASTVRKELKFEDPAMQYCHAEYMLTSNKDVPLKFDDSEDQRRFMVMEADATFTRKDNPLADEVFTKLYGKDAFGRVTGTPLVDDVALVQQFKHELYSNETIANTNVRDFKHTAAYKRCYDVPRKEEAVQTERVTRSLAPFIVESLKQGRIIDAVNIPIEGTDQVEILYLKDYLPIITAMQYVHADETTNTPASVAICPPIVFPNVSHAIVKHSISNSKNWLSNDYNLRITDEIEPLKNGFYNVKGEQRYASTIRFSLTEDTVVEPPAIATKLMPDVPPSPCLTRVGTCLRANSNFQPDCNGEFETVNEMRPDVTDFKNKSKNVQYMDTFLFESDDVSNADIEKAERNLLRGGEWRADKVFAARLALQKKHAQWLFNKSIVRRVVYSGGKSLHLLVRVKDAPNTIEEYKWLHRYLALELGGDAIKYDLSVADPARFTRAPIDIIRTFDYGEHRLRAKQRQLWLNDSAFYTSDWRSVYNDWLARPLDNIERVHGRRMHPTKPEYKEAAEAMLNGVFFTDHRFDGQRQHLFFTAYRVCRESGWSAEQLWSDEGILYDLDNYYRANEREGWRNCRYSATIQAIDSDYDDVEGG